MPMLRKLIQYAFNKFGYRIVLDEPHPHLSDPPSAQSPEAFFSLLKRYGFNPKHIIDVGANKGTWTRRALPFFPDARYTLIEPQNHLKVHIQDLLDRGFEITWIDAGVAEQSGTLPFTISYRDDSCSFAPTQVDAAAPRIPVRITTLNEIVSATGVTAPEMVKIDAEGFDLKVLAGASKLLGKTEIFFVEVTICSTGYENTIVRVIHEMNEAGYKVVDITDINRSPKYGLLWLCELAFLRNDSALFDSATAYE
jgi:FkbM family methyltransferase